MTDRKTALVTGASRGIGRAIAAQLAADGWRVAAHYGSNRAAAEDALRRLDGDGHMLIAAGLSDTGRGDAGAARPRRVRAARWAI